MNESLKLSLVRKAEMEASRVVGLSVLFAVNEVQKAIQPLQAEEQLIVILSALRGRVAQLGAAPQFDVLREALDDQILQLHDALQEVDGDPEDGAAADLAFAEPGHAREFEETCFGELAFAEMGISSDFGDK